MAVLENAFAVYRGVRKPDAVCYISIFTTLVVSQIRTHTQT